MDEKFCARCEATLAIDEFGINNSNKDGRARWCLTCMQVYPYQLQARKKGAACISAREWRALCQQYDNCCACCGEASRLFIDHIINSTGLRYDCDLTINNVQPLCKSCNSRKHFNTTDYRKPASK